MKQGAIRVLSVDDHAFVIEGLEARMQAETDMELVGRLDRADDLLETVRDLTPDVVVLDIEMPGADVFDALHTVKKAFPEVRCLLLSAYVRDHYIDEAHRVGAWGYLAKSDDPADVIKGIRGVANGEVCLSPKVRERLDGDTLSSRRGRGISKLSLITDREKEVLRMIARGMSRTEIAEQLCRSPMTIDNHRKSIMKKLDINDRADLVRFAIAEGLVEVE